MLPTPASSASSANSDDVLLEATDARSSQQPQLGLRFAWESNLSCASVFFLAYVLPWALSLGMIQFTLAILVS